MIEHIIKKNKLRKGKKKYSNKVKMIQPSSRIFFFRVPRLLTKVTTEIFHLVEKGQRLNDYVV